MTVKDTELLEWYNQGWKDEMYGSSSTVPEDRLINKAYNLGAAHALLGDDIRSVDYLLDEEILKMIYDVKK